MVPIGGKPLLEHLLELVRRHGITDVLINSHHLAHVVEEFVQRKDHGINIRLSYEPSLLGSAGTVAANRDFVGGEEDFFIIYADCLTDMDLSEMLEFHRGHSGILTVGVYESPHPEAGGVVTLDPDNRVVEFAEKPQNPKGNLVSGAIFVSRSGLLDYIPESFPSDLSYDVLPRVVGGTGRASAASHEVGKMYAYRIKGYIIDIGTHETYEQAQTKWLSMEQGAETTPEEER